MQRRRHGELGDVAGRPSHAVFHGEQAVGEEHADGLDRVERDALGTLQDPLDHRVGQAGNQADEQLPHLAGGERLEDE